MQQLLIVASVSQTVSDIVRVSKAATVIDCCQRIIDRQCQFVRKATKQQLLPVSMMDCRDLSLSANVGVSRCRPLSRFFLKLEMAGKN